MSKVILKPDEIKNLINMIKSEDASNATLAFEIIENCNISKSLNNIFILFKFTGNSMNAFKLNTPKAYQKLIEKDYISGDDHLFTLPKVLTTLLCAKASPESIALYFELHTDYLNKLLESWGYPMGKLQVELKLKM